MTSIRRMIAVGASAALCSVCLIYLTPPLAAGPQQPWQGVRPQDATPGQMLIGIVTQEHDGTLTLDPRPRTGQPMRFLAPYKKVPHQTGGQIQTEKCGETTFVIYQVTKQ
jgi:hypothetical protein